MKYQWGADPLSEHIEIIFNNARAASYKYRREYKALLGVHDLFSSVVHNFSDPMPNIAPLFIARSHAAFIAGVTHGLGGHTPDCYILLRGCIENSLYSFYLHKHPDLVTVWINRHDGNEQRRECRKSFQMSTIMKSLEETDPRAHKYVSKLYDRTIDCGAHPNMMSVFTMMKKGEKPSSFDFSITTTDKIVLRTCLKDAVHTGLSALTLYCVAYADQFDMIAVKKQMLRINKSI